MSGAAFSEIVLTSSDVVGSGVEVSRIFSDTSKVKLDKVSSVSMLGSASCNNSTVWSSGIDKSKSSEGPGENRTGDESSDESSDNCLLDEGLVSTVGKFGSPISKNTSIETVRFVGLTYGSRI